MSKISQNPAHSGAPTVSPFLDKKTNTLSYVVVDPATQCCAVIDTVMEFDSASGRLSYQGADKIIEYIVSHQLTLEWLIETHVHADHLSAAPYIQKVLGGKIGIGQAIMEVQSTFAKVFNEGTEFERDGSQFDKLFRDEDTYTLGSFDCIALHTPGHTPACMAHCIGDAVFVGDTLFMPDAGTARADFPGGDAGQLYDSISKVLTLPEQTRVFVCHDYGPNGRDIRWETSIAEQRDNNIHIGKNTSRETFIQTRQQRDALLSMPKLIIPALQVNMRAGTVPTDDNGDMMLKYPINKL